MGKFKSMGNQPYPSEQKKEEFAAHTKLTLRQIIILENAKSLSATGKQAKPTRADLDDCRS